MSSHRDNSWTSEQPNHFQNHGFRGRPPNMSSHRDNSWTSEQPNHFQNHGFRGRSRNMSRHRDNSWTSEQIKHFQNRGFRGRPPNMSSRRDNSWTSEQPNHFQNHGFRDSQNRKELFDRKTDDRNKALNTEAPSGDRSPRQESFEGRRDLNRIQHGAIQDVEGDQGKQQNKQHPVSTKNDKKSDGVPRQNDTEWVTPNQNSQNRKELFDRKTDDRNKALNTEAPSGDRSPRQESFEGRRDLNRIQHGAIQDVEGDQGKQQNKQHGDGVPRQNDTEWVTPNQNTSKKKNVSCSSTGDRSKKHFSNQHLGSQVYDELDLYELCVRNFPYGTTEEEMLKPFRMFGANGVKIINNKEGRGTLAFAQFRDYESAVEAFTTLDCIDFKGRRLYVSFAWNTFCPEDIVQAKKQNKDQRQD